MRKVFVFLIGLNLFCCSTRDQAAREWAAWQCEYIQILQLMEKAPFEQADSLWKELQKLEEERIILSSRLQNSLGKNALNPADFQQLDSLSAALSAPCWE